MATNLTSAPRATRRSWRSPRRIAIVAIGLFLAIQLFPTWLWQTNPPVQAEPAWDSTATRALAQRACFDCHSNQTNWPLYSRVAPSSWLVTRHVVEGRERMNLSTWGLAAPVPGREAKEPGKVAEDAAESIEQGEMPPQSYLLLHPEARLSPAEQRQLIDGLLRSLQ